MLKTIKRFRDYEVYMRDQHIEVIHLHDIQTTRKFKFVSKIIRRLPSEGHLHFFNLDSFIHDIFNGHISQTIDNYINILKRKRRHLYTILNDKLAILDFDAKEISFIEPYPYFEFDNTEQINKFIDDIDSESVSYTKDDLTLRYNKEEDRFEVFDSAFKHIMYNISVLRELRGYVKYLKIDRVCCNIIDMRLI